MHQLVSIQMKMPDLSRDLQIGRVYQVNDLLIIIVNVVLTGNSGEESITCEDRKTVLTKSDTELAVKYYFINPHSRSLPIGQSNHIVDSIDKIPEIQGETPLPMGRVPAAATVPAPKNNHPFWKKTESLSDSWEDSYDWDSSSRPFAPDLTAIAARASAAANSIATPSSADLADDEFEFTLQYSQ